MQEGGDFVAGRRALAFKANVGKHPVVALRHALERQAQAVPHRAVRAVAADQPGRLDHFLPSVGVTQACFNLAGRLAETQELHLPLHPDADGLELRVQQPFRVALGKHQGEVVRAGNGIEPGASQHAPAVADSCAVDTQPGIEERGRATHPVHQLERTAPNDEGLGRFCRVGAAVDYAHRHAIPRQLGRQREANRSRADDQHLMHALSPKVRATS